MSLRMCLKQPPRGQRSDGTGAAFVPASQSRRPKHARKKSVGGLERYLLEDRDAGPLRHGGPVSCTRSSAEGSCKPLRVAGVRAQRPRERTPSRAVRMWLFGTALPTLIASCVLAWSGVAGVAAQPSEVAPGTTVGEPDTAPAGNDAATPLAGSGNTETGRARGNDLTLGEVLAQLPKMAEERAAPELPLGTLKVKVIDVDGQALPDVTVLLGSMAAGERERTGHQSDASGEVVLPGLATGANAPAYRITVPRDGARYMSTPFRMPEEGGYEVTMRYIPTGSDERAVIQLAGRTFVEFRDERMRVTHSLQFLNFSASTYLFPGQGREVKIPEAAVAFSGEKSMNDLRIEGKDGESLRMLGSLPPGLSQVGFAYDIPIRSRGLKVEQPLPFILVNHEVLSETVDGMTLRVRGFPETEERRSDRHALLATALQRLPEDPPVASLVLEFSGLPRPAPWRYIAALLAGLIALAGVAFAFRRQDYAAMLKQARAERQAALLAEVQHLEMLHASDEIGAGFYARQKERLRRDLAAILRHTKAAR